MSKNYFAKPSAWKDNFEDMRIQSDKIRKMAGMEVDIETSLSQEGRDYIEMLGDVVKITPDDYKDAMRLSALKHGRMRAEEDNRTRIRSSSKDVCERKKIIGPRSVHLPRFISSTSTSSTIQPPLHHE